MTPELALLPWLAGAATVILLLWLCWRRPNRNRLAWRMTASVIAGISLVLMLFPPTYERPLDAASAVLLTEGHDPDTLSVVLQQSDPDLKVYSYQAEASGAVPVSNLYTFIQENPALQTIHVLGYGLKQQELEALDSTQIIPHYSAPPTGISGVSWPATVQLGNPIAVSGQYQMATSGSAELYLLAAGKVQDSVLLKNEGLQAFQLNFIPKQEGRFVYLVLVKVDDKTDTLGQVPVQILPAEKLSILILASTPSFEFKFLKNHLGELQHQVALRSTVSKGITRSEWVNMPRVNLDRISSNLLTKFDLVISEPQALQDLNRTQRNALQQAVTQQGLGVLMIRGEQQPNRSTAFFTNFPANRVSQQDSRDATVTWGGENTQAKATAAPYTLVKNKNAVSLVQEASGGVLAAAKKQGWGYVGNSLIPQTFSWQLEGKHTVYASYWAYLLSELARKEEQEKFWQLLSPESARQGKPVILTFTDHTFTESGGLPEAIVSSSTDTAAGTGIALRQHPLIPEQFTGTFWPQTSGWHTIAVPDAPAFHFFVQDSTDWTYTSVKEKRDATREFVAQQSSTQTSSKIVTTTEQVSVYWFFLLFVISSGFLWLEEKL